MRDKSINDPSSGLYQKSPSEVLAVGLKKWSSMVFKSIRQ